MMGNGSMVGCRIGGTATITIRAESFNIIGCNFATALVLHDSRSCTVIACDVPAANIGETGTSSGNKVEHPLRDIPVEWGAAGTAPSIGNGALFAAITRTGNQATWYLRLLAGPSTAFGAGSWSFTLPITPYLPYRNVGQAWMFDASSGNVFHGIARVNPTDSRVEVFIPGGMSKAGAAQPFSWAENDELNIELGLSVV